MEDRSFNGASDGPYAHDRRAAPYPTSRCNSTRAFALLCALTVHMLGLIALSYVQFRGASGGDEVILNVDVAKLLPDKVTKQAPTPVETKPTATEAAPIEPMQPQPLAPAALAPAPLPPPAALNTAPEPPKKALGPEGGDAFMGFVQDLRQRGMDVVFVFDSTTSMGDVIDEVKANIRRMIAVLHKLVPECRLGVVTYRDQGSDYVTKQIPLTADRNALMAFVNAITVGVGRNAEGVEDWPEQVRQGLADAIHSDWRPRARKAIILIGDAPAPESQEDSTVALALSFRRQQHGVVHTIYVRTVSADNMSRKTLTQDELQLARAEAREYSDRIKRFFAWVAKAGGGEALELKGGQEVVRHLLTLAFGVRWSGDIQKIYDRAGVE